MVAANRGEVPRCDLPDRENHDHQKRIFVDLRKRVRGALSMSSGSYYELVIHEIEIEIYPLQKGVLKDIISHMGCNSLVVVIVSMGA